MAALAENMIDEKELAVRLGLSRRTIQRLRYKGGGPQYFKLNGAVRYALPVVENWLSQRVTSNTAERAEVGAK